MALCAKRLIWESDACCVDGLQASLLPLMLTQEPYPLIRDSVVAHPTVSELISTMFQEVE